MAYCWERPESDFGFPCRRVKLRDGRGSAARSFASPAALREGPHFNDRWRSARPEWRINSGRSIDVRQSPDIIDERAIIVAAVTP